MLEPFGTRTIISASRRTDIPAFHGPWLMERLRAGYALVRKPYSQPPEYVRVDLRPANARGMVLWSKNFGPLMGSLDQISRIIPNLYFHFTITGLPGWLEPHVPGPDKTAPMLLNLAERFSPEHVCWRFDPICLLPAPPGTSEARLDEARCLESFTRLADRFAGHVRRCVISFVQRYAKAERAMRARAGMPLVHPPVEQKRELAEQLARMGAERSIKVLSCCDPDIVSPALGQSACIDAPLLSRIWNAPGLAAETLAPTRKHCGCARSVDIGAYSTCAHGCLYCYAAGSLDRANGFVQHMNPLRESLDREK